MSFFGPYVECLVPVTKTVYPFPGEGDYRPGVMRFWTYAGSSEIPTVTVNRKQYAKYCLWDTGSTSGTAASTDSDYTRCGVESLRAVEPAREIAWFQREYAAELMLIASHFGSPHGSSGEWSGPARTLLCRL